MRKIGNWEWHKQHDAHVTDHRNATLNYDDAERAYSTGNPVLISGGSGRVIDIVDRYIGARGSYVIVATDAGQIPARLLDTGERFPDLPYARKFIA